MRILKKDADSFIGFPSSIDPPDSHAENAFSFGGAEFDTQGQSFSYLGAGASKPIYLAIIR